jgi:small conductance mechanosensitive channel
VLFSLVSKWVGKGVRKVLVRVTDNKPISDILGALVRVAVVILGVLFALGLLELDKTVTSVLAGVGVLGLALGLAFQDIAANFMSGFLMAIKRPIDVGDLVEVAGKKGRVDRVELRATVLTTLDGLSVIVPNKQVYQAPIVNYTRTRDRRMSIDVGVAYNSPLRKVKEMVLEVGRALEARNPDREPEVLFHEFGDSSINLTLRVWLSDATEWAHLDARSEAVMAIKEKFDENHITIPFPIRTLDFGATAVGGVRLDAMAVKVQSDRSQAA